MYGECTDTDGNTKADAVLLTCCFTSVKTRCQLATQFFATESNGADETSLNWTSWICMKCNVFGVLHERKPVKAARLIGWKKGAAVFVDFHRACFHILECDFKQKDTAFKAGPCVIHSSMGLGYFLDVLHTNNPNKKFFLLDHTASDMAVRWLALSL